jgi:hypothetical protein
VVKVRFAQGLDLGPVQARIAGEFDVLGYNSFGDPQSAGNVLMGMTEFELETQNIFDLTHSDPSGIGHVQSSKSW